MGLQKGNSRPTCLELIIVVNLNTFYLQIILSKFCAYDFT